MTRPVRSRGAPSFTLLAVVPNPSVDRLWSVPGFRNGGAFRVERVWAGAGGKGCNVARVAAQVAGGSRRVFGRVRVAATGFVAGSAGQFVERRLRVAGVRPAFVRLASGETRTCPSILDPLSGEVTELREPGPPLAPREVQAFERLFVRLLEETPPPLVVTLSGSLPPDLPPDFYARAIGLASERRVATVLDSSAEPLLLGAARGPWAVKVNQAELMAVPAEPGAKLADEALTTRLGALVARGATLAVVTRGSDGLLAYDGRTLWRARPPAGLAVLQPVGSGDAATAALALGVGRLLAEGGLSTGRWPDLGFADLGEDVRAGLIRDLVAAAAANAVTEGIGNCPPEVFLAMRPGVVVEAVAGPG